MQVIEDTVAVVAHVRKQHAVPQATPNIVVGGSYGRWPLLTAASGLVSATGNHNKFVMTAALSVLTGYVSLLLTPTATLLPGMVAKK